MHGDFTRWTFAPKEAYRSVLLQQGRVVLDADWNEQAALTAHHDETRTLDLAGPAGGPLTGAGFAIVGADGAPAEAARWEDLSVTPGRYYVAGMLVEAPAPPPSADGERAGWPLCDQPHLREVDGLPALSEPPPGRYTAFLDVWTHHVTADERPALREAALGGPDTSSRAQTVWQVRVTSEEASSRTPRSMAASLGKPRAELDPCAVAPTGGYLGLENQLYRVQIHHPGPEPTFLWSRENGSVVAGVTGIASASETEPVSQLTLDREGRDEELSIRKDDLVEVTSTDLQIRRQPGFLATVVAARGLQLSVRWSGPAPTLDQLGRTPLVRRWEGLLPVTEDHQDLENGVRVRFPSGGTPGSGDHWLIPARTSRLLHGQTSQAGTIEWPPGADELGEPMAPVGTVIHSAPLALLTRDGTGWTLDRDCRRLFPAQTELITLDLAGGDGQQAPPGSPLPQPVRVAARNGGLPLPGAPVLFTVESGVLTGLGDGGTGQRITEETGPDGVAAVTWTLDPQGGPDQRLTATLLEHRGAESGILPELTMTGHLAIAARIAWQRPAEAAAFDESPTVQNALERLATLRELRLLGGDGQHLGPRDRVLPQPVRAVVDSACGPVQGATVAATAGGQGLVAVVRPSDTGPPEPESALWGAAKDPVTGPDGTVAFWWQPDPGVASDVLHLRRPDGPDAPLAVTAQKFLERAVAADVSWTPPGQCPGSPSTRTVQAALAWLAERRELRLVSGDGQYPRVSSRVLPQPVRVVVDSACGPVRGATVVAGTNSGALVAKMAGSAPPDPASSAWTGTGESTTDGDGTAAFWWQPVPGAAGDTLRLRLKDGDGAVVTVTLAPRPGVHITAVKWLQTGQEFRNDDDVTTATLVHGISAVLDRSIDLRSIMNSATDRRSKPVCHVALDLPGPLGNEFPWAGSTDRNVKLSTVVLPPAPFAANVSDQTIEWRPINDDTAPVAKWLTEKLPAKLGALPPLLHPVTGRFVIEGSAIVAKDNPDLRLNCHAPYVLDGDRTRLLLPTDDAVPGGRFVQWFRLKAS